MKFIIEPYNRNISKTELQENLRTVANQLGKTSITTDDYRKHGLYSPELARRLFGSWFNALEQAGLERTRNLNLSADECIDDLKAVAKRLGKASITQQDYAEYGQYSPSPLIRHFGSWFKALDVAGLERTRTWGVTEEEYFENLEHMWTMLGRQPRYREIQKPFSKYSAGAYERRFGSWRKSLEAFVASMRDEVEEAPIQAESAPSPRPAEPMDKLSATAQRATRNISWRLRFLVMRRDNFRCRACGRSPAMQPSIVLHVDHVKPWINYGETTMENLQTLCKQCNIGKSDLAMNEEGQG